MDYNGENIGCGGFLQILFGVSLISIAAYFFLPNPLFSMAFMVLVYVPPVAMLGLGIFVAALGFLMSLVQSNLRKAKQQREGNSVNYVAIAFLLLIPAGLGGFMEMAHLGLFYSLMMLAWSFFAVNLEN
jgi:hypothetical protein